MNDSEKEAEDIVIKFSTDMDSCPTEIELECLRDSIADKLKSKQDEIERLKNLTHFGYSEVPELKKEIERLTKELSEAEAEVYRLNNSTHCSYCEFEVPLDVDSSVISEHIRTCENHPIRDYEKQIQSLTAMNKERVDEIERLKKCDVCGGTDLVCGKGWKEGHDKLSEEISALTKKLSEAEAENQELLKTIQDNGKLECETVEMQFDPKATASIVKGMKEEIERLTKELSMFNDVIIPAWKKEESDWIEDRKTLTAKLVEAEKERDFWKKEPWYDFTSRLQKENQQLNARNKALEHIIYLGLVNGTVDYSRWKSEAVRALESSKDYEDFKKSEKDFLKTINQQGDEIKELKQALSGRTVSCEACNGMAEKVKELEEDLFHKEGLLLKSTEKIKELEVLLDKKVLSQVKEDREKILSLESKLAVAREAITKYFESERIDALGYFGVQRKYDTRTAEEFLEKALAELGEKQ